MTATSIQYAADGTQKEFYAPFPIYKAENLDVHLAEIRSRPASPSIFPTRRKPW